MTPTHPLLRRNATARFVSPGRARPKISVQKISVQKISVQKISVQKISVQNISFQKISVQKLSVQKISVQRISVQKISVQKKFGLTPPANLIYYLTRLCANWAKSNSPKEFVWGPSGYFRPRSYTRTVWA